MAEQDRYELLDAMIDGTAGVLEDPELAVLAVIAAELRGLPDPQFKRELKGRILPMTLEMTTTTEARKPPGFGTVTPYLVGNDIARLHAFLRQAFDAEILSSHARPDGSIMHSEVRVGDSLLEMGQSERAEDWRRSELHLYVEDADATYARALAAGAQSLSAPVDQAYGDREAGVADPIGNHWYIATHGVRPEGLRSVTPFLHARGAAAFIEFMKGVFGARETSRFADESGVIRHAVVHIGDSAIEIGEAHGPYQPMPIGLHVFVDDVDAVYARALRAGAAADMEPKNEPYGQRVAGVRDQDGNRWFIAAML